MPVVTFRPMARIRLDMLLTERGLAPSGPSAATSIRAGKVRLGRGGARASKPGQLVADDAELQARGGTAVRVARRAQAGDRAR